jgi:hypothetical protein
MALAFASGFLIKDARILIGIIFLFISYHLSQIEGKN